MSNQTLFVTGASGQLGRLVLGFLAEKTGVRVIGGTRDPAKTKAPKGTELRKADFDDPKSLAAAFQGVDRLLLISTDAIGRRVGQHKNAIEAAKAAGVKHIVYTSLINPEGSPAIFAPEHVVTEKMLKDSGTPHTILRNNIYSDMVLAKFPHVTESGVLAGLAGNGGLGYVTREDCARAAAAALASTTNVSTTYEITGPAVVTQTELAEIVSNITGKKISYVAITPETLRNALSPQIAELVVSLEFTISQGKLAVATGDYKKLTGREPQDLRSFLQQHRAALMPQQQQAQR